MEFDAACFVFDRDAAYQAVVHDLLRRYPEHYDDLDQLNFGWPTLKEVIARSAFFVSPAFPASHSADDKLMTNALRAGIHESLRYTGTDAYGPFLKVFMSVIGEVVCQTRVFGMTADDEQQRWGTSDAPLCQWAASVDRIVLSPFESRPSEREAAFFLVAARVLAVADLAVLINQQSCAPIQFPLRVAKTRRKPDSGVRR